MCVPVWKVMLQVVRWVPLWTPAVATVVFQWPTAVGSGPTTLTASCTDTSSCLATSGPADRSSSTRSLSSASRQRRRPSRGLVRCQRAMSSRQTYRTNRWGRKHRRHFLVECMHENVEWAGRVWCFVQVHILIQNLFVLLVMLHLVSENWRERFIVIEITIAGSNVSFQNSFCKIKHFWTVTKKFIKILEGV